MIENEVQTLADLSHPNIVKLIEVNQGQQVNPKKGSKTVKFIVLELVGGGELFDFVALGGRLTESQACHYFTQMLDGLQFMHEKGYAHRDLKPENLILDKDFNLKITDFGFAAPIEGRDCSGLLSTQLGTASYMAPEIHLGKPYEGAKVDLFASAIILFVILTQRPPFASANPNDPHYRLLAANRADIFWQAHAQAEQGNDIYSAEFKDLFQKLMALNPAQRPTIADIRAHPWMQQAKPSHQEIRVDFTRRKAAVDLEAHNEREAKREQRQKAHNERQVRRSGNNNEEDGETVENARDAWQNLEVEEYGPFLHHDNTQFFMTSQPLDYFDDLVDTLHKKQIEYRISGSSLRLKFETRFGPTPAEESKEGKPVKVNIQVLKVNDDKHCVKFSYRDPATKRDISGPDAIKHFMSLRDCTELRMFCDTTFEGDAN